MVEKGKRPVRTCTAGAVLDRVTLTAPKPRCASVSTHQAKMQSEINALREQLQSRGPGHGPCASLSR